MSMLSADAESVAKKLKQAREATGLSTREVASQLFDKTGVRVSHATIGNYERAVSVPTIDLLRHLAILYDRNLEWFLETGLQPKGIRFRKTASRVKVVEERQYVANATRWLEAYRRLELRMGRVLNGTASNFRAKPSQTGKELAQYVRREVLHLLENVPIYSVINVLEEFFGVRVIEEYAEARIDAFAAQYGDEHVVVLNPRVSNDRSRLNAGHELGHVLFLDCGENASSHKEIESRAYEFALNLLMPEEILREAFRGRSMVKLVKYKEEFGVSMAAMIYRAEKTGILSKQDAEWLWRQFSIRGWRQCEPGNVRPDRATRFETMFEEATGGSNAQLSRADCLKAMGVREEEMQARLDVASGIMPSRKDDQLDSEIEGGGEMPNVLRFPE